MWCDIEIWGIIAVLQHLTTASKSFQNTWSQKSHTHGAWPAYTLHKHHSGRGLFCPMTYKLYPRTFSVVNQISSNVSDANYAERKEPCGPCSQGYHSLIEKAETSRKHNKRLLVLNSEHVHTHSTITEARGVGRIAGGGLSQGGSGNPDALSPWKRGSG